MKHGTPSQANRGPKNPGRSEWLRLADAIRHPRGLKQMQMQMQMQME